MSHKVSIAKWVKDNKIDLKKRKDKKEAYYKDFVAKTKVKDVGITRFLSILRQFEIDPVFYQGSLEEKTHKVKGVFIEQVDPSLEEDLKLVKVENLEYPDDLFIGLKTNTIYDKFCSRVGGVRKGFATVVPGEPGIGKTSVLLTLGGKAKEVNKKMKIGFISSEMNQMQLFEYSKRISFKNIDTVLLGDYQLPHKAVEKTLKLGYDLIILDSIEDTVKKIAASGVMRNSEAQHWLVNLINATKEGKNQTKTFTSFYCVQHMTKGGTYVGDSTIEHMTDAMMYLRYDTESGKPYMKFKKNRGGDTHLKLYFMISDNGVTFDETTFKAEELSYQQRLKNREDVLKQTNNFDDMFKKADMEGVVSHGLDKAHKQEKVIEFDIEEEE